MIIYYHVVVVLVWLNTVVKQKCLNKSNTSVFQLKQELVYFSSSNAFSIAAKLDSSLNDFQCQSSISANTKANSTKLK